MYYNVYQQRIYKLQPVTDDDTLFIITDAPKETVIFILNKIIHDEDEFNENKFKKKMEKEGYGLEYLDLATTERQPITKIKEASVVEIDFKLKKGELSKV